MTALPAMLRTNAGRQRLAVRLLVLYPLLIAVGAVVLFPVLWMFYSAFKSNNEIYSHVFALPQSWSFHNFSEVLDSGMDTWLYNSVFITVVSTVLVVAVSAAGAYAFAQLQFRGREPLFVLMLIGLMVPPQALMIAGYRWMDMLHLVDTYWALILTYAGWSSFGILVLRNFFASVPRELIDAARVDGAGHWQIFTRIMLPLARPSLSTVAIFNFMWVWNEFVYPLVYTQSPEHYTVPIGILQFQGRENIQLGTLMSGLVVATIVPLLVYLIFQRQFIRGLFEGALKG